MSELRGLSFNLIKDSPVLVKIAASNSLGQGPMSATNNPLISPSVETIPDSILIAPTLGSQSNSS